MISDLTPTTAGYGLCAFWKSAHSGDPQEAATLWSWDTHLNSKLNKCSQNKKPITKHILPGWLVRKKWATAHASTVRLYKGFFEKKKVSHDWVLRTKRHIWLEFTGQIILMVASRTVHKKVYWWPWSEGFPLPKSWPWEWVGQIAKQVPHPVPVWLSRHQQAAPVSPAIVWCELFPVDRRQQAERQGRTGEWMVLVRVVLIREQSSSQLSECIQYIVCRLDGGGDVALFHHRNSYDMRGGGPQTCDVNTFQIQCIKCPMLPASLIYVSKENHMQQLQYENSETLLCAGWSSTV